MIAGWIERLTRPLWLLALLLWPALSQASAEQRLMMIGGSAYMTQVVAHSDGRVYAASQEGGVYRSDDQGKSWTWLSAGVTKPAHHYVQGLAVSPVNEDLLLVSSGSKSLEEAEGIGIWRSEDGGQSWKQVLDSVNFSGYRDGAASAGPSLLFDRRDSSGKTVYAGGRGSLLISRDAGLSWEEIAEGTFQGQAVLSICLSDLPTAQDNIWVGTDLGLWYSADNGESWTPYAGFEKIKSLERGPNGDLYFSGLVDVDENGKGRHAFMRLKASDWSKPNTYLPEDLTAKLPASTIPLQLSVIKRLPSDKEIVICYEGPGEFIFLDESLDSLRVVEAQIAEGESSLMRNDILRRLPWIADLALLSDEVWLAGTGSGIMRTEDGGRSWSYSDEGLANSNVSAPVFHPEKAAIVAIPAKDTNTVYFRDGGESGLPAFTINGVSPIWPDDVRHSVDCFFSPHGWYSVGTHYTRSAQLVHSQDEGENWKNLNAREPYNHIQGLPDWAMIVGGAISPHDPNEMLLVVGEQLTRGFDSGSIYRSQDGGRTFDKCFIRGAGRLGDWLMNRSHLYVDARAEYAAYRYLFVEGQGLYRSSDHGDNWEPILTGEFASNGSMAYNHEQGDELWLMATRHKEDAAVGLYRISEISSDKPKVESVGSMSYVDQAPDFLIPQLDVQGQEICVFGALPDEGYNQVYYSTDAGKSWKVLSSEADRLINCYGVAFNPHRKGEVWVTNRGHSVTRFRVK